MSPNKLKIELTYSLVLLSLFFLSCDECEEVSYIDLIHRNYCPIVSYGHIDNSIYIISNDDDIDKYARKSIEDYCSPRNSKYLSEYEKKRLTDESYRNTLINDIAKCIRQYNVDFSKYSIAAISTVIIQSASTHEEQACSNEINVYMIMEDHTDFHNYSTYLLVPKGNYKLNVEKVWPPTGPY